MELDYDTCAQFLARFDADLNTSSDNSNSNNINSSNSSHHTLSASASPASILDTSFLDNRNSSSSPPGLSSGSATSHSPESLRFDYDVTAAWNPNDQTFFSPIDESGILAAQSWDVLMPPADSSQQQNQQQQQQQASPLSDYIKIEDGNSPGRYTFSNNQQATTTISPSNSLIDPTTQTALEGTYSFGKDSDSLFDFNTYGGVGGQPQGNGSSEAYTPLGWRNQGQQRDDFAIGWQSPPPPQAQQPPRQQRMSLSQEQSHSLSPASSHHSHRTTSSPESRAHDSHSDDNSIPRPKKRKTDENTEESAPTTTSGRKQQPKKTAHNMIEKRYRTNLNDKIAALRDSVPSLRVMAGTSKLGEDGEDDEDLEGLTPAHKLNKATVLAKATEYIRHLEKRTKRLQDENDQLKNRLAAFEKLANMGPMNNMQQNGQRGVGGGPGGGLMSRLMVGSLAGLMVANGLQENENGERQLFAIPVGGLEIFNVSSSTLDGSQLFWLLFKMVLLFSAVVYVFVPGFFDSRSPSEKERDTHQTNLSPVPSLASSIEIRRTAWLTAVQSVWIPRNSLVMELAALGLKALKLSLRKFVGWHGYSMLTGTTEEHEVARIKAWTIALDAQLAGGDAMITQSRLLLTLLASMTLPATRSRLMLNALHIKVLFWDLGSNFESLASKLATYYWNEARKVQLSADPSENLPEHLARLLDLEPSDVLDNKIIQKAYNLAYDQSTGHNCEAHDEGMDTVVEDESIRSPLDALAAWYSSLVIQSVLATSLKSVKHQRHLSPDLQVALSIAPPNSKAQLRTLVAKAILDSDKEGKDLRLALKSFEEDLKVSDDPCRSVPKISITPPAVTTTTDVKIAIRCAMALNLLANGRREGATRLFADFDWQKSCNSSSGHGSLDLGLLGFVAIWKTLNAFVSSDGNWVKEAGENIEGVAAVLRIWVGGRGKRGTRRAWVETSDCKKVIDFCTGLQKKLAGLEEGSDDGYVSGPHAEGGEHESKLRFCVPEPRSVV